MSGNLTYLFLGIEDGQVIFINSTCGHKVFNEPKMVFYNASKLALTCVVEGWRREVSAVVSNLLQFKSGPFVLYTF
jgi:NADP-dependent 3-hydroxy acid dehydrogenase YdfG